MIWVGLAIAVWAALVGGALCLLWRAPLRACAAMVVVVTCSLIGFATTPDGVLRDTLEGVHLPINWPHPGWQQVWGANVSHHGTGGWNVLPVTFAHMTTGTWIVERVLGLFWHSLMVGVLAVETEVMGLPIVIAVLSATRFALWTQRHHMGSDILLMQVLLLVCLNRMRRELWVRWLLPAALVLVLLHLTYWVAWVAALYPLIVLGVRPRTLALYTLFGVLMIPAAFSWPDVFTPTTLFSALPTTPQQYLPRLFSAFAALWDPRYSKDSSWFWSYPGAQELPAIVCGLLALGICVALVDRDGRRWIVLFCLGMLPTTLIGNGASHRQLMALVPAAILAAWPLRLLPPSRATALLAGVLAVWIGVHGMYEWLDPGFWLIWTRWGQHGF